MPNWCYNVLHVEGRQEDLEDFDEKFKGKPANFPPQLFTRDMTEEEVKEAYEKKQQSWEQLEPNYCFNALYPVPPEIEKVGHSCDKNAPESFNERLQGLFNPEVSWDGHSWCVAHWGTKWDIYSEEDVCAEKSEGRYSYRFDTAWSPPTHWLDKVASDFPHLRFVLAFTEEMAHYAGEIYAHGEDRNIVERDPELFDPE